MITSLGKRLRKLRIDKGIVMYDLAKAINVSSAFLSAVERGNKKISDEKILQIANYFKLDEAEKLNLQKDADRSNGEIIISLSDYSDEDQDGILAFARQYKDLSDEDKNSIRSYFGDRNDK
ncbi:MAG: helix-turn-helix transcriptional regulator [Spirochaetales bacterium]|nr:helix-turn-helix transcriptional regulator [Spirochaetales bacterium]